MRQRLLFEIEDNMLAVGDHVRITNDDDMGYKLADYLGIPEGTKAVVTRIHPDDGCTVHFDDYLPTRPSATQKHEYACYKASLKKLPFAEVRLRQLDDAIKELQTFMSE